MSSPDIRKWVGSFVQMQHNYRCSPYALYNVNDVRTSFIANEWAYACDRDDASMVLLVYFISNFKLNNTVYVCVQCTLCIRNANERGRERRDRKTPENVRIHVEHNRAGASMCFLLPLCAETNGINIKLKQRLNSVCYTRRYINSRILELRPACLYIRNNVRRMLNGMLCSIVCSEKQSTTVTMMMMTLTLVSSGYQRSSLLVRDFLAQFYFYYLSRGSKCYVQHEIEKTYFEFELIEFHKCDSNSNSKLPARRRVNKSWQWCYGACTPYTLYTLCLAPSFCQWLSLIIIIMGWFCIWHMKKKTKRNAKIEKKSHKSR